MKPATESTQRPPSLRWRLLAFVSIASVLVISLAAVLSVRQARHDVQELMDGQMSKTAALILLHAQRDPTLAVTLPRELAELKGHAKHIDSLAVEYQIGTPDGKVLVRSTNAPDLSLAGELGIRTTESHGVTWRCLTLETADSKQRIQVTQAVAKRNKEAMEIARKTIQPVLVFLPLLLGAIFYSIRRALKPLDDLAKDVVARNPQNLAPLLSRTAPQETVPLVMALNRLFQQVSTSLENERRFTADAAHELRTPLAATRIQAQVALLAEDASVRQHALEKTIAGMDRATHLVEQMLRLARLDPLLGIADARPIDLASLARSVAAGCLDRYPTRRIEAVIDDALAPVPGDAELLQVALRNLIDNAIRYSPAETLIEIALGKDDRGLHLAVLDNGPGVTPETLARLGERFFRGTEVRTEGNGLGLTIVRRIADLHGAVLEFTNRPSGGLVATICWSLSPSATRT